MTVKVPVLIKPLWCCHSGSVPGGTGGCFPVRALVPEVCSRKKSQFEGLWHGGRGEKALCDVDHSLPFPSTVLFLAVAAASQWVMGKWMHWVLAGQSRDVGHSALLRGLQVAPAAQCQPPCCIPSPGDSRGGHTHGLFQDSAGDARRMQQRCELQPCCVRLGSSLKPPHGSPFKGQAFFWSANYPYVKLVWVKGEKGTWKYSDNKGCSSACRYIQVVSWVFFPTAGQQLPSCTSLWETRRERVGKSSWAPPLPPDSFALCIQYLTKVPVEEVWSDMINTENVVSLWHAASSSHFTHTCTSTSLYTLLQMLSLPHPQIKAHVDPCKADTWETGPKVPGARREFVFGLQLEACSAGWAPVWSRGW